MHEQGLHIWFSVEKEARLKILFPWKLSVAPLTVELKWTLQIVPLMLCTHWLLMVLNLNAPSSVSIFSSCSTEITSISETRTRGGTFWRTASGKDPLHITSRLRVVFVRHKTEEIVQTQEGTTWTRPKRSADFRFLLQNVFCCVR